MLQNPHHYPWRHVPSPASCSFTGAGVPGQALLGVGAVLRLVSRPTWEGLTGTGARAASSATTLVVDRMESFLTG